MGKIRPYGLPAAHRLRSAPEFLRARRCGRRIQTPHFIIYSLLRDDGPTRLGLTVSKKVGGAVQRNRVKRLLRECFRRHPAVLMRHADLSVIAKKGASGVSYKQVCYELIRALDPGEGRKSS